MAFTETLPENYKKNTRYKSHGFVFVEPKDKNAFEIATRVVNIHNG